MITLWGRLSFWEGKYPLFLKELCELYIWGFKTTTNNRMEQKCLDIEMSCQQNLSLFFVGRPCLHIVYVDAVACLHIVQVILYLVKLSVLSILRQCTQDLAT